MRVDEVDRAVAVAILEDRADLEEVSERRGPDAGFGSLDGGNDEKGKE